MKPECVIIQIIDDLYQETLMLSLQSVPWDGILEMMTQFRDMYAALGSYEFLGSAKCHILTQKAKRIL